MKKAILSVTRLFLGLFLFAVGIIMTINANVGLAPWDVFNDGLTQKVSITIGQANIIVGFVLIIGNSFLGERLGWGTISNMIFVGVFMDILRPIIPTFESKVFSVIMLLLGLFVIGIASYFYIGAGLGSGPRDSLMVALTKKTKKPVSLVRNAIEITVLIVGYILGGRVGLGTLISATTVGFFVQFAFKIFKFDVKSVKHRFIDDDIRFIKEKLFPAKKDVAMEKLKEEL